MIAGRRASSSDQRSSHNGNLQPRTHCKIRDAINNSLDHSFLVMVIVVDVISGADSGGATEAAFVRDFAAARDDSRGSIHVGYGGHSHRKF